jgi:hypothetical protein
MFRGCAGFPPRLCASRNYYSPAQASVRGELQRGRRRCLQVRP